MIGKEDVAGGRQVLFYFNTMISVGRYWPVLEQATEISLFVPSAIRTALWRERTLHLLGRKPEYLQPVAVMGSGHKVKETGLNLLPLSWETFSEQDLPVD